MRKVDFDKVKVRRRYEVRCFHRAYLEDSPDSLIAEIPYGAAETVATSERKAINNVRYRLENQSQYAMDEHNGEIWYYDYQIRDLGAV